MTYLTETEFLKLGFEDVEDFEKLAARARLIVDCISRISTILPILKQILNHASKQSKKQWLIKSLIWIQAV